MQSETPTWLGSTIPLVFGFVVGRMAQLPSDWSPPYCFSFCLLSQGSEFKLICCYSPEWTSFQWDGRFQTEHKGHYTCKCGHTYPWLFDDRHQVWDSLQNCVIPLSFLDKFVPARLTGWLDGVHGFCIAAPDVSKRDRKKRFKSGH